MARLLAYVVCIAALPRVRQNASPETRANAYRLRGGYTIPLIGFGICLWLITQTTRDNWTALGILLAIGAVLYLLERRFGSS